MGLATAYQLAKNRQRVLLLERFTLLNDKGSSAGVSRQFRVPYPDEYMVQLVLDSVPYWTELQQHTSDVLLEKEDVGTLWFGDPNVHTTEGNIAGAMAAMDSLGVSYTSLTAAEIEQQYHFKNLPTNYIGLFQEDGASINLEATLKTLRSLVQNNIYVTIREHSKVVKINNESTGFSLLVEGVPTPFVGKKLVIVPGPYINSVTELLGFRTSVTYWQMSSAYFKKTDPNIQYPTWFAFQQPVGNRDDLYYGFPAVDWDHPDYIRVAPDFVMAPLDNPDNATFQPNAQELALTEAWVRDHMTGLDPTPELKSTCMMALTNLPNKELLLDFAPNYVLNHQNIIIQATGWAAKFIPLFGKILADLAIKGTTPYDISHFAWGSKVFKRMI
ncbi:MAG: hypothetical protein RL329_4047 [Bacteroidota bacterium]